MRRTVAASTDMVPCFPHGWTLDNRERPIAETRFLRQRNLAPAETAGSPWRIPAARPACLHAKPRHMPALVLPLAEIAPHLPPRGVLVGLDLGTKTIGVAVCDAERRLAVGIETISRKGFRVDAARLLDLAKARQAVGFVLGLPINMDGSEGPRAQSTRAFARNFA